MFSRTQKINLSPIKQIEILASKIPDVVSLAQGIPSFDTPGVIKKAVHKALHAGRVAKYSLSPGMSELREAVEQALAEENMFYDFEKEIIVTVGSIEGITASLIATVEEGKNEIILFSPSYTSYAEAVKVAGGVPVFCELEEDNGWKINFDDLVKQINHKTAGILFANPNNPTGTIFPKEDLLKIAELSKDNNFFIICDEVYKDFIYENEKDFFSIAQVKKYRKNIIRVFSFSKAYAMTGWRVGFVHSDEENIKEILKIHDSLVTCAPVISQYGAISALDFANDEIRKFGEEFKKRRDLMCNHLDELSYFFSYQKPVGSYFVFPKLLQDKDSWEFSLNLLKEAHVAVVPGVAFGPNGEGHIRLSFGRNEKDINEAFVRIKEYLISRNKNEKDL